MISIIILHHNKAEYSAACLQSLLSSTARPLEVINVDNGSQDSTPGVLRDWKERAAEVGIEVQYIHFDSNVGAVRGRNAAMEKARGDYLVFLDNDTLVAQSDWLQQLRAFLEENPQCAIVAPKLLFPWQPFDIECCGCAVSPRGRIQYLGRGAAHETMTEPFPVQCAISAAWMMPRRIYETVGPLDEVYSPVQYEDLDYCYRIRAEYSGEVWMQPQVELYHFEHTTTAGSGDINFAYVTTKNGITFKRRWGAIIAEENGASEEDTQWATLPKFGIGDVDWQQLIPPVHQP